METARADETPGLGSSVDSLQGTSASPFGNDVRNEEGCNTAPNQGQSDFGAAIEAARATQAAAIEAWEKSRAGSTNFGAFVCRLWERFAAAKGCEAWPHAGPDIDTVILWLWHVQRTPQRSHVEQRHERYMQLIKQTTFSLICQKCPGFKAQPLEVRKEPLSAGWTWC